MYGDLSGRLAAEIARAIGAENSISTTTGKHASNASTSIVHLTSTLTGLNSAEVARATATENDISGRINLKAETDSTITSVLICMYALEVTIRLEIKT
jgi:hypothetical protein